MRGRKWFWTAILMLAVCFAAGPSPGAGEASGQYGRVISSEEGLAAYWRMEGDLTDEKGNAYTARPAQFAHVLRGC